MSLHVVPCRLPRTSAKSMIQPTFEAVGRKFPIDWFRDLPVARRQE